MTMSSWHAASSLPPIETSAGANVGPLPFAINSLVGRKTEIGTVVTRLTLPAVRLLTLIGPGGIGKSRLALEAARVLEDDFDDGAHLILLAPVTDPELVPILIFHALGLRAQIVDERDWWAVRERNCLLVVDNFEQVLEAAPILVDVLANCPKVKVLATSRIPLNLTGEYEYRVPPLTTPPSDRVDFPETSERVDAVQLFVDRSVAVQSGFELTAENVEAVARITRHLDGLPLAIELAAAQCRHLTPEAIEHRLIASIGALAGGPVDRPPHQRALRDTIAWSYDLLDPDVQRKFRQLSVFAGCVMPQAADYVCGIDEIPHEVVNPADDLADYDSVLSTCVDLAEQSLLVRGDDFGTSPQFSILMTIRSFGQSQLREHGEWDVARQRHAEWFLALAIKGSVAMHGPDRGTWLDWLELEHENLRTALDWFHQQREIHSFSSLASSLREFWLRRSYVGEGARWLNLVLEMEGSQHISPLERSKLLNAAGWMALRQGRIESFRNFAAQSLDAARSSGDKLQIASSLRLLGEVEDRSLNYEQAKVIVLEANQIYRDAGDLSGVADTQASLGGLALDTGEYEHAVALFHEGIEAAEETGDLHLRSRVTSALCVTLFVMGNYEESRNRAEQSLEWYETTGDLRGTAVAREHIGRASRELGDLERAWECYQASLIDRWKFGELRGLVVWLEAIAELILSCDGFTSAASVLGGADQLRSLSELPLHNHERRWRNDLVETLGKRLDAQEIAAARQNGAAMSLRELIDYAWVEADRMLKRWVERSNRRTDRFAEFGLTPREREIADLLAERLTDREISQYLSISPRTANAHVTRVLAKLGVHSRRDVAQAGEPDS